MKNAAGIVRKAGGDRNERIYRALGGRYIIFREDAVTEKTVDISKDDPTLTEMVRRFGPRAKVTVVDGDKVVGRVVLRPKPQNASPRKRMIGLHEGAILYMAEDFDAPLPDEFWLGGEP